MALKGINWVHNNKIRSNGLERSQFGTQWIKSGHMVLKALNCVHNDKIRSNGPERSNLGIQCRNQVKWS